MQCDSINWLLLSLCFTLQLCYFPLDLSQQEALQQRHAEVHSILHLPIFK